MIEATAAWQPHNVLQPNTKKPASPATEPRVSCGERTLSRAGRLQRCRPH